MNACLVLSTAPNRSTARQIAKKILKEKLAACVQLAPVGESHYWWKGRLEKASEVAMTFKTSKKALPFLMRTLKQIHPYETPEILAVRVDDGSASYLKWLMEATRSKG